MKFVRLFGLLFSMSLRRYLAFRADLVFEIAFTMLTLAASLAALAVVFTRTDNLAGWSLGETITLFGTFQIITGLRHAFVEPNLQWFNSQVKDGKLDNLLIQPEPTILLATLGTSAPLALAQVGLGGIVVVLGVLQAEVILSPLSIVAWLALLVAATAVMWATRVVISAAAFWALGLELKIIYDALWEFARYPAGMYPGLLQLTFTYIFPIAFIATVPAEVLLGGAGATFIPVALAVPVVACALACLVWRQGLRRYTSATS